MIFVHRLQDGKTQESPRIRIVITDASGTSASLDGPMCYSLILD